MYILLSFDATEGYLLRYDLISENWSTPYKISKLIRSFIERPNRTQ